MEARKLSLGRPDICARQAGGRPSPILQNHLGVGKLCNFGVVNHGRANRNHSPGRVRPGLAGRDEAISLEAPLSKRGASVVGLERVGVIRVEDHNCALRVKPSCACQAAFRHRFATARNAKQKTDDGALREFVFHSSCCFLSMCKVADRP